MECTLQIFGMAADTGDFRSSARLLPVKCLSQATCCTLHIILNSDILSQTRLSLTQKKKDIKTEIYRWCKMREWGSSIHTPYNAECERMFKGQTGGRGICPYRHRRHLISFPRVLKALHHSSVFITVDLPVCLSGLWW